jgi:multiple sugar transport system substrate-binding protein
LLAFTSALCVIASTAGCSSESDEPVDLQFWAFGNEGEAARSLLSDFAAQHPEIRLSVQPIPWVAAHEKLLTAFAADNLPDVCHLGNTWIPEFVALDALQPLDTWLDDSSISPDNYFPGIWETNRIGDHLYGVPWYVDTRVLFYRRDLLAELGWHAPPATWDEWAEVLGALRTRMPPDTYPILLPTNEWEQLTILGLQATDGLLREGNRYGNFRSEEFQGVFAFYLNMYKNAYAPRMRNTQWGNVYQDFAEGRYAMYVTGPWNVGEFRRQVPAEDLARWSAAPLPSANGHTPGVSLAGGGSLVVTRAGRHKKAAWQLVEFLSRPEVQLEFYRLVGDLPARTDAWDHPKLADNRWTSAFHQQLSRVAPPPRVPEWERIATKLYEAAERVIDDRESASVALVKLDEQVDAILEKRRWMLTQAAAPCEQKP